MIAKKVNNSDRPPSTAGWAWQQTGPCRFSASARNAEGQRGGLNRRRRSDDVLLVEQGSLYPALHRLEERGWVTSSWGVSETNRRARFYRLTPKGRKQLVSESNRWTALTGAVARAMGPSGAKG